MRFHIQSRIDLAHTDQRPCSSGIPLLNPPVSHCHSSSQAVPRQNHKVQNTQVSVSPPPQVLQSQPCSDRNGQQVGNAAGKASAPVGSPSTQGPGQHTGHCPRRAQTMPGLIAPFLLTRCSVSGAQDVVTAHVHTQTIKSKHWRVAKLAQKPHLLTEEIFFLTKMNLNPHHSAASRAEKLRRNRQCGK